MESQQELLEQYQLMKNLFNEQLWKEKKRPEGE